MILVAYRARATHPSTIEVQLRHGIPFSRRSQTIAMVFNQAVELTPG
jgi:hypothetical protein